MVPLCQFPHRTITCLHMSHNIAVCSLYEDLLTSRAERASPKSHNFTPFLAVTSRFSDLMSLPPNTIPNCSASVNHHFTLLFDSSPYEEHCPCKHPHLQVMLKQEDKRQCLPVMLLYHSLMAWSTRRVERFQRTYLCHTWHECMYWTATRSCQIRSLRAPGVNGSFWWFKSPLQGRMWFLKLASEILHNLIWCSACMLLPELLPHLPWSLIQPSSWAKYRSQVERDHLQ